MTKADIVQYILQEYAAYQPNDLGEAYAPSNIALCKYWGKRNTELNLPVTSSLSISLANKGARTRIRHSEFDQVYLNGEHIPATHPFSQRVFKFLDLFRPNTNTHYHLETDLTIPVAAGLASSACGMAALVLALNNLYGWQLNNQQLSIFSRLGSGSAARSLWHGFVEWHSGIADDGLDSFAEPIQNIWPDLRIGLHILETREKSISSSVGMQRTLTTSKLYPAWPQQVANDLPMLKQAISTQDFYQFGAISEHNALTMHATMLSSWPPILYSQAATITAMHQVWALRAAQVPVYFTQDAGPNLKLLFLAPQQAEITTLFPNLDVIAPFDYANS